jgi:death-on-curing protein
MDHRRVGLRAALAIHDLQIVEHGGADGLRDMALLESALARPHHLLAYGTPDIAALAASYAGGISRNHPFVDGNKRTGLVAMLAFLGLNGRRLEAPDADLIDLVFGVAEGRITKAEVAVFVRRYGVRGRTGP